MTSQTIAARITHWHSEAVARDGDAPLVDQHRPDSAYESYAIYHLYMGGTAEDGIDFDFDEVGDLVSALLAQANRDDVADELDYPGRREAFAEEFIGLTVSLGGSVDVAASKVTESDMPSAGYLVPRTRIHIRLKRASWQTALALVPLIASIVATGGVLLPLLAATPLLAALKDTLTPLTEDDRVLVVAVTVLGKSLGRAVTAAEVQDRLGQADRRTATDVQTALQRLAAAHVLEWDGNGFRASF